MLVPNDEILRHLFFFASISQQVGVGLSRFVLVLGDLGGQDHLGRLRTHEGMYICTLMYNCTIGVLLCRCYAEKL